MLFSAGEAEVMSMETAGNDNDRTAVYCESEHYYIKSGYEEVRLYSKKTAEPITLVGEHYGDPEDGIIDRFESSEVITALGHVLATLNGRK